MRKDIVTTVHAIVSQDSKEQLATFELVQMIATTTDTVLMDLADALLVTVVSIAPCDLAPTIAMVTVHATISSVSVMRDSLDLIAP